MDPLIILFAVLAIVGIWALVELALTLRSARGTVDALDKTVDELNETLAEAKPVISKLDGALDELQPALSRIDPLLEGAGVAVDALSANLVEVEAVVRDVSQITGAAASAGSAVSTVADSASEAVQRLLGRRKPVDPDRALRDATGEEPPAVADDAVASSDASAPVDDAPTARYYTYAAPSSDGASSPASEKEEPHA